MRKDPERIGASIHNRRHDGPVDAQRHPRSLEGTNSRVGSCWEGRPLRATVELEEARHPLVLDGAVDRQQG